MDYRVLLAAPLAALMLSVNAAEPRMPSGWMAEKMAISASQAATYEIGLDPKAEASGPRSLMIKSVGSFMADSVSYGAASQDLYGYAGKRVRFAGQVRAEGVRGWAGLRLDAGQPGFDGGAGEGQPTLMKIAQGEPGVEQHLPMGSAAAGPTWQDMSVVIDVPADALSISFGLVLTGEGQVWARRMRFDVVGPEVPLTRTTVGIDWAKGRAFREKSRQGLVQIPPSALQNAALE